MSGPGPSATAPGAAESRRTGQGPSRLFLCLGLVFGLAVLAANPPFQSPDEYEHFFRAVQLSQGVIIGTKWDGTAGGLIPAWINKVGQTEGIPFHPERKMTLAIFRRKLEPAWISWNSTPDSSPIGLVSFPHTVVYAPSGYVPQAAAIFLGKACRVGPLGLMYLARLAAFITALGLGWSALRLAPRFQWSMLLLLLCPTSLYLMGSLAPDGILIAAGFLLASLACRFAAGGSGAVEPWEGAAVIVLGALLATAKFVYLPLAATGFVLALFRLGSPRLRMIFSAAWVAGCLALTLIWCWVVSGLYVPGRTDIPLDPGAQLHFVALHPLAFLALVGRTIIADFTASYRSVVATMGWADTFAPDWFYPVYGIGLLACLVLECGEARPLSRGRGLLMLCGAAAAAVLVYFAEYLIWNSPGSRGSIDGIAGRYFLPIIPFVFLALPRLPALPQGAGRWIERIGPGMAVVSAAVCLWSVLARYYFAG